jgi:hypothetical protein
MGHKFCRRPHTTEPDYRRRKKSCQQFCQHEIQPHGVFFIVFKSFARSSEPKKNEKNIRSGDSFDILLLHEPGGQTRVVTY